MSATEGKWEVVNTKQKKKAKEKERNEKRQLEKLERKKLEQQEEQRKREEKERFYAQYVSAKKTGSDPFELIIACMSHHVI